MKVRNINILVQENLCLLSKNIKNKLENKSYKTHFFQDTHEAIHLLKKETISLIVLNNLNMLKEIKKFYNDNSLAVLIVLSDTSLVNYYIKEGATDFINITVLEDDLLPRIDLSLLKCQKIQNLINLTNTDFLTNLYNKRYFYEKAQKLYEEKEKLAVCMIDIDDFKMINDTYGHLAGDYVIKKLASILQKNIKGKDLVARFGGDEFCIMFQDISPQDTHDLMQKIQNIVKYTTFNIVEKDIRFTISIGITTEKKSSLNEMLHFADLNLFNSKLIKKPKRKICTNCKVCKSNKKESAQTV